MSQARSTHPLLLALIACAVYLIVAAVVPFALEPLAGDDETSPLYFAVTHAGLPFIVAAGLVYVRRWSIPVWRVPAAAFEEHPRRWWMLLIPAALLAQIVVLVGQVTWADQSVIFILTVAVGTALVGVGEELYFRGILRAALETRHGETVTLIVTSLLFGAAHSLGSALHGLPLGFIAFQVGVTALDGVMFFAVLKSTGRLWVAIVLHAAGDFARYLGGADDGAAMGHAVESPTAWLQILLTVLGALVLVSALRTDHRARKQKRVSAASLS